jgi:chromosome segregation ATPase
MEKGQRTALQDKLEEIQYLYDNYDVLVINKIVNEYNNALLELDNHKIRTVERLNIMKERLTLEYKENYTNLEEQILSIQDKLTTHNKTLQDLNTQLNAVLDNLANLDKSNLELHNIDNSINQLETTITKIKNDKTILEGQF